MTPFDAAYVRTVHDERTQRLRRTRRWAENRPSRRGTPSER